MQFFKFFRDVHRLEVGLKSEHEDATHLIAPKLKFKISIWINLKKIPFNACMFKINLFLFFQFQNLSNIG